MLNVRRLSLLCVVAAFALAIGPVSACGSAGEGPGNTGGTDAEEDAEGNLGDAGDSLGGQSDVKKDGSGGEVKGDIKDAGGDDDGEDVGEVDSGSDVADAIDDTKSGDAGKETTGDTASGDTKVDSKDTWVDPDPIVIPECALLDGKPSCQACDKCPDGEVCGPDGKSYANDCYAICKLQIHKSGLKDLKQGKCPPCAQCTSKEIGEDKASGCNSDDPAATPAAAYCVTTKSGTKVSLCHCQAQCAVADGGKISSNGACKAKCSDPVAAGGAGCSANKYTPVCAKEDGKTYFDGCQLNHCNVCLPVGIKIATAECSADTDKALTKECDGECFDPTAYPTCVGKSECSPVCGILPGLKGMTFRNACVATAAGASLGDCTEYAISDKCSAQLYVEEKKPCCPTVDYTIEQPMCGEDFVTYRNASELQCFGVDKLYSGPCICKCNNTKAEVCGADGITYQNACQAKCYNKEDPNFVYNEGACQ